MDYILEFLNAKGIVVEQQGERLLPTGECWCGCGGETRIGAFFLPGHDKVAESAVIMAEFGSVAALLRSFGYGPSGKNARAALKQLTEERRRDRHRVGRIKAREGEVDS